MNASDRDDIRHELRRAADLQLTKDYTAQVWQQGQRQRQHTMWAVGAGVAASVAAAAVIFSETLGGVDATQQLDPAGTTTQGPTSVAEQSGPSGASAPDAAATTDAAPSTAAGATTQASDAAEPIPVGHGVVVTPMEGWRLVHDRDLAAGADPESLEFLSCLQPEDSALGLLGPCTDGVQIWTGFEGEQPEVNLGSITKELPDLAVLLVDDSLLDNGIDAQGATDGTEGVDLTMVEQALAADPDSPGMTSRFLNVTKVEGDVVTGEELLYSLTEKEYAVTGETFSMAISEETLCTEAVVSDSSDRIIACADLLTRVGSSAETPMTVVYSEDGTLWRLSEDVLRMETG